MKAQKSKNIMKIIEDYKKANILIFLTNRITDIAYL